MSSSNEQRYWFRAKRYGWGWGWPLTWHGWVVLLTYLSCIIAGIPLIQASLGSVMYCIYALALTAILTGVCWLKGEPPRSRWGGRDA
jgi:hypothetical protein